MAAEQFDPVGIIEVLSGHGVEFVIIGAFAAELHAAPIPRTQDVDVTPSASQENLARLSTALEELEARVRTTAVPEGLPFSHDAASLARGAVWNLTTNAGDLDISFQPSGTEGYADLMGGAVIVDVGGNQVAVAALSDVIRSKRAAGRPKDAATLPALRAWLDTLAGVSVEDLRARAHDVLERRRLAP